ncbi:coiled-coil domain-containing protein 97 [Mixophyes fleayi]|uniref:coiled-coil domain-containing protein 97 n=1 Tax=Mixophyes fleayi TaxID=3061075 RepID=UPI003F4DAC30
MAAPSAVSQELPGRSELEGEEGLKGDNDDPESIVEALDENTQGDNSVCGENMDTCGEDSKLLERTLKEVKRLGSREDPISQDSSPVTGPLLDMFTTIGVSQVPIRSQQKGDPEFSHEQKMSMLHELYTSKPLIFLERFRKVLKEEHLDCFTHLSGDYTADFYFKEIRKASLKKVNHTRVRNKRYAALQQLISAGEYFSDEQMRARDPLMYEHYVGQYLSEEEIMSQNSKDLSQASSLSDVLLNSCEEQSLQRRLEAQRDMEESCMEEEEDDGEEEESELPSDEERLLMREEFISRMHQRFLDGKDRNFDYKEVDDNPDFDNLDIVTRDAEERYFDDDDDDGDDLEMEEEEERNETGQRRDSSE